MVDLLQEYEKRLEDKQLLYKEGVVEDSGLVLIEEAKLVMRELYLELIKRTFNNKSI